MTADVARIVLRMPCPCGAAGVAHLADVGHGFIDVHGACTLCRSPLVGRLDDDAIVHALRILSAAQGQS